jgi:hypothetical protein
MGENEKCVSSGGIDHSMGAMHTEYGFDWGRLGMKNKRLSFVIAGVLLLLSSPIVTPSPSYACLPAPLPDLQTRRDNADVIFMGKVVAADNSPFAAIYFAGRKRVLFTITSVWKGPLRTQAIVSAPSRVCDYTVNEFHKNEGFLVFANTGALGSLDAFSTREIDGATEDIEVLGEGRTPIEQVEMETLFVIQSYWAEAALGASLLGVFLMWVRAIRKALGE